MRITLLESFRITAVGTADKFRFVLVTIIAQALCTVNRNAIVLLTIHQKYYGYNFYISTALLYGSFFGMPAAGVEPARYRYQRILSISVHDSFSVFL